MTVSIWRYSHRLLAILTSIFVLIASLTGIILAIEPISDELKPYAVSASSDLSIADLITSLNDEFEEVISVEVDDHRFLKASVFTKEGKSETFYINPENGNRLGDLKKRAPIYDFATNLHRSLFLKSTGRFLIGLVSFLMILITITGSILIAKRQGGFKRWFSKVIKEELNQYYHVVLGRYALIPILIIAISGVMLSMDRFSLLPDTDQDPIVFEEDELHNKVEVSNFQLFKDHQLNELVSLEYPFSDDESDFFILKLKDAEYQIKQYTGETLMVTHSTPLKGILNWAFTLHTGQGTIIWSFVLLLTCLSILYFMYSGFFMSWKRLKANPSITNTFSKDEVEYVVLVGSETGNTLRFAQVFVKSLMDSGLNVFIDRMNNYNVYQNASQLIIITSTYGEGDAPTGAADFLDKFKAIKQPNQINFAVVGFGSLMYPDYCKYADDVDEQLRSDSNFKQLMPAFKINNQSEVAFKEWVKQWGVKSGINIRVKEQIISKSIKGLNEFLVIQKSGLNADNTFTIQLEPKRNKKFKSGDLLAIYPEQDGVERLYSIGKIDNQVLLSIIKHDKGVTSRMLGELSKNQIIKARIKRNLDFHFPSYASEVIMISNGTGIAPFLGMINDQTDDVARHLFWGGRNEESLKLYYKYINKAVENNTLASFNTAYSRSSQPKQYVQDLIVEHKSLFKRVLSNDGVIMICGGIAMQNEVLKVLNELTKSEFNKPLSYYEANEQLKMDCY